MKIFQIWGIEGEITRESIKIFKKGLAKKGNICYDYSVASNGKPLMPAGA